MYILQPTTEIIKSTDNKEIILRSILFVDPKISAPSVNLVSSLMSSAVNNRQVKVIADGQTYTVYSVEVIPDDDGKLHHYEVLMY